MKDNFDIRKFITEGRLYKEQEDTLEPEEEEVIEPDYNEEVPEPDEQGNVDDEEAEEVSFTDNDAFVMRFDTPMYRSYIPFRASQAKKAGFNDYDSAAEEIYRTLDIGYSEDDFLVGDPPYWTDEFAVIDKKTDDYDEDRYGVEWVEYAQQAPTEDLDIGNWYTYMDRKLKDFLKKDTRARDNYLEPRKK